VKESREERIFTSLANAHRASRIAARFLQSFGNGTRAIPLLVPHVANPFRFRSLNDESERRAWEIPRVYAMNDR